MPSPKGNVHSNSSGTIPSLGSSNSRTASPRLPPPPALPTSLPPGALPPMPTDLPPLPPPADLPPPPPPPSGDLLPPPPAMLGDEIRNQARLVVQQVMQLNQIIHEQNEEVTNLHSNHSLSRRSN
jgi:hypothetical protein